MKTKQEYVNKLIEECKDNGIYFEGLRGSFEQEWYEYLLQGIKQGKTITQEIFDSLNEMQKWYLNKHYLIHGIKIIE